jgi:aryl-alcohol dehydrogenase-like predicted oxidoreductase
MHVTLGRTGIVVQKDGFGALPIQRRTVDDAIPLLQKALDSGINFFDTARGYTDSEEKLGIALSDRRGEFIIASKSHAKTGDAYTKDLDTALHLLKTDHIDIYQFHNPETYPKPGDGSGLYEAALVAKKQGKIRFIGLTNHRLFVAQEAVKTGLFDTLQYPFNYLSIEKEIALVKLCEKENVGFIAMKALSGGLLCDVDASRAWLSQFPNVVPIWGIQLEAELDALIAAAKSDSRTVTAEQQKRIDKDRAELTGDFCRSCGYCAPCPANIKIFNCARVGLLLRRSPPDKWLTEEWQGEMQKINDCIDCGACETRCPYNLPIRKLLKKQYADYQAFLK